LGEGESKPGLARRLAVYLLSFQYSRTRNGVPGCCTTHRIPPIAVALLAAAIGGCGQREQATAPVAPSSRALCMQAPQGHTEVDGELRAQQQHLRSTADAGGFVAVGRAWVRLARHTRDERLYRHAEACARQALEHQPELPDALTLRGLSLMTQHRFEAVVELAEGVLGRDGDNELAWALLSDARLELGQRTAAIDAAQRMLDLRPGLPAYARAAHLRFLQGDSPGAKRLYRRAIRAGQHGGDREALAWVLCEAAQLFLHEGDHAGADAGFDQALGALPDYAPALLGKGRAALARGDFAVAKRLLSRAHAAAPSEQSAALIADANAGRTHAQTL
jgi:tetratricopeptide (TPR) repeat protein